MTDRYVAYLRLDEIKGASKNPKEHDLAGIKRSIAHHGVAAPLLLDERTGCLIGGHGTLEALRGLHADGRPAPSGVQVEDDGMWMMPVFRGFSSRNEEDAASLLVALNRLSEKGGWFEPDLAELLASLDEAGTLELSGYSQSELDDLLATLEETEPALPDFGAPPSLGEPRAAAGPAEVGELGNQMRRTRGLEDLKSEYEASNVRVLVLSYPGARYVWVVEQLAALFERLGVENNADAVLKLIAEVTGEAPPDAA